MKYLLDTHTLLWVLFEDEKLSKKAQKIIRSPKNEIYVSLITYWEIALKYGIGKLELENITPEEIPRKAKEINIDTLAMSERDVSTYFKLPKIKHKDPFDRLIIWQAINENITLISKDKEMKEYEAFGLEFLWD
jgi:PIN domain nuclease of toxin-antitoxin system